MLAITRSCCGKWDAKQGPHFTSANDTRMLRIHRPDSDHAIFRRFLIKTFTLNTSKVLETQELPDVRHEKASGTGEDLNVTSPR